MDETAEVARDIAARMAAKSGAADARSERDGVDGLDSLEYLELLMELETRWGVRLDNDALSEVSTIGELARRIVEARC